MAKSKKKKTVIEQCKDLPKDLRNVCVDAAVRRYERHYHPRHKHHRKHMVADIALAALVLILVIFSAYILLFYRQAVLHEQIDLTLSPLAETVTSGGALRVTVEVENNSGQSLFDTAFEFPKSTEFIVASAENAQLDDNFIALGTLDDGEKKSVTVTGYVISDIERFVRVNTIFRYRSNPYVGSGVKLISDSVEVTGSSLLLDADFPETIIANQPFNFEIGYKNDSEITHFEQVTILPNWPPGFEILDSSLPLSEAVDYWQIESIGSLEMATISGRAQLITADLERADITVKAFASPAGAPLLQQELNLEIPVRYPDVNAQLKAQKPVVSLGQELKYDIVVKNNEEFSLNNVKARLRVNPFIFNPASYSDLLNEDGEIEVNVADVIDSGASQSFIQSLFVRQLINPASAFGRGEAVINMSGELVYEDSNGQTVTIPLQPEVTAINSDLSLDVFARYYSAEGDQIGRGPIPPIVGETTKYWVFLHINNSLHSLSDVVLTADLPLGAEWTDRVSVTDGKALSYNAGSRTVTWPVGNLPDYKTRFDQTGFGAAFEIAVTPQSDSLGKNLLLLQNIRVQGLDSATGRLVSDSFEALNNDLAGDSYAPDDGIVQL